MRSTFLCFSLVLVLFSFGSAKDFSLENLVPGLEGHAITAGQGNTLETFPIEVIALQRDMGLGFPLVLIRASGEFIDKTGGVAAGMSGSPVYLKDDEDDLLLGAIGYVFPSSDHNLALVTPIAAMRGVSESLRYTPFNESVFTELGEAVPVTTPLLIAGLSERALAPLEPLFQGRISPFAAQLGSGSTELDDLSYNLEPGSALSVQLVRGDITVAGVGTVTDISGDTLLAFGHPLLGQGNVSFAFAPAFITYIVPSSVVPFKLADSGNSVLGSITQDRPAAISGTLDLEPSFLPVTLSLTGDAGNHKKQFEISNDERYYAPLLASAIFQIFDEVSERIGSGTTELSWDIRLKDGDTVRVLEQITDPFDIAFATALLAGTPLDILADNIFETPQLESIALNIVYEEEERYAEIVEVVAEKEELEPSERLVVHVRLQPYRGEPEVKTFSLELPDNHDGFLDIDFRGGMETDEGDEDGEPILSYGELLVALRDNVQSKELIIETYIEGERERLERIKLPYLVRGLETVSIKVEEPDDEEDAEDTDNAGDDTEDEERSDDDTEDDTNDENESPDDEPTDGLEE